MVKVSYNTEKVPDKRSRSKSNARNKTYTAPALSKGLDILELMAAESKGLRLIEIADQLERSKGEIFRMLVVLEQRGYVAAEHDTDKHILTAKLFKLAHQHPRINQLTNAAATFMAGLAKAVEQSCHLVIYYSGRGLVIAQQDSPLAQFFGIHLGTEIALPDTCSGHLLLAYAEPQIRTEMLLAQPAHLKKRIAKADLTKIVDRILKQGYESVASKQIRGVNDIGYPVFDFSGKMAAALVVPFLEHLDDSNAVTFDKTKSIVKETAASISNALDHKAPI